MSAPRSSHRPSLLARVAAGWQDIRFAQRRMIELNRPGARSR